MTLDHAVVGSVVAPDTGGTTGSVTERLPHIFQLPVNVIQWDAIHGIVKPLCIQQLTDLPHCHWRIQGGATWSWPRKPRKEASCLLPPPQKAPEKLLFLFYFESKFETIPKIVYYFRGVFSFGGTLGLDPAPSSPPPKTGGWIRQCSHCFIV